MTSKKSILAISWNKHVTEYQASGLTQAAYCRKHQLKVHNLSYRIRMSEGKKRGPMLGRC
jgi:hypothetical protein